MSHSDVPWRGQGFHAADRRRKLVPGRETGRGLRELADMAFAKGPRTACVRVSPAQHFVNRGTRRNAIEPSQLISTETKRGQDFHVESLDPTGKRPGQCPSSKDRSAELHYKFGRQAMIGVEKPRTGRACSNSEATSRFAPPGARCRTPRLVAGETDILEHSQFPVPGVSPFSQR